MRLFRRDRPNASYRHRAEYENVLGTSFEFNSVAGAEDSGPLAEQAVLAEIDRLESIFSVYRPVSEFNRWQSTHEEPVSVSRDLAIVLEAAEQWRIASKGAFLPTVEALTRAWRRRERGDTDVDMPQIDPSACLWTVDSQARIATRLTEHPASLNAIAKGYIVDRAVEVAREVAGIRQVVVNIGGDLRHWGAGATQVSIADPANPADNATPLNLVTISNQALATSGGYRRGFRVDGGWFSHIFDPGESKPCDVTVSASLISLNTMSADVLATILSVLPPKEGIAFADQLESVGALVVDSAGNSHRNGYWKACSSKTT